MPTGCNRDGRSDAGDEAGRCCRRCRRCAAALSVWPNLDYSLTTQPLLNCLNTKRFYSDTDRCVQQKFELE